MPNPKSYSRIAIAVSAALTSMVFSAHAAWIDVDSLPSSGLVSSLSPELQALFPAQANASFAKTSATPNYVYQWSAGTIPVFGNGLTLNGPEQKPSSTPLPLFRIARRVARALFSVMT